MSNDYTQTLPPVPGWAYEDVRDNQVKAYGHACAEHARAPLIARIAELEKELSANDIDRHAEFTHRLLRRAKRITEQGTRIAELEAEIAQVSGYCETLTQRCVDDTAENGRLRAEVEALRAEVQQLKNDEACIHFSGAEDARAGVHELFTGLADCEIEVPDEWHEKPLLRFMFEVDPGDDTVGMGSSAAWSLAKDQSGTVLLDLLSTIRDADAQRTLLDSARYKMQAFRDWLINEIAETQTGTYDVKRIYAEDIVDQFEEGLDAAIAARKGEGE